MLPKWHHTRRRLSNIFFNNKHYVCTMCHHNLLRGDEIRTQVLLSSITSNNPFYLSRKNRCFLMTSGSQHTRVMLSKHKRLQLLKKRSFFIYIRSHNEPITNMVTCIIHHKPRSWRFSFTYNNSKKINYG